MKKLSINGFANDIENDYYYLRFNGGFAGEGTTLLTLLPE